MFPLLGFGIPLVWSIFTLLPFFPLEGEQFFYDIGTVHHYVFWFCGVLQLREALNLRKDFEHWYLFKKYCNCKPIVNFEFKLSALAPQDDFEPLGAKEVMLWFGASVSFIVSCVCMLVPHLVVLLWEVMKPLGDRASFCGVILYNVNMNFSHWLIKSWVAKKLVARQEV